jgi:gluconolactonase
MSISDVRTIGNGVMRPEGIMVLKDGTILTADARGQCARIDRTGKTTFFGDVGGVPNGICVDREGNCIIANIGSGEVQCLSQDGRHRVLATEADGKSIPSPNFPFADSRGRLWVSNSTDRQNLDAAIQRPAPDGSVVLIENGMSRIVADGIYFANGVAIDPEERYLYVAETTKRDVLRFKIASDGALYDREVYGPALLGPLGYPDGIAFDEAGNLWVTFPAWNAVGYISPEGDLVMVIEDPDRKVLKRPTNICFGWEERKTAFIGSLDGSTIPYFQAPYPGMRLVHQ